MSIQREIFYAEREGVESSPNSVREYISLNFTPKQAYYLLFAGALTEPGSGSGYVPLTNFGADSGYDNYLHIKNALDQREAFFCLGLDYTGFAYNDSWGINYGGVSKPSALNKAFMCAMEVTANDEFTPFSTEKSGVNTSYQTWESRTIPAGNWLLIGYAFIDNISSLPSDDTAFIKVNDGVSDYGETLFIRDYTGSQRDIRPWVWMKKVTLAAPTTYDIQVKCGSGNGYYVRGGFFAAINLDDFENNYFAESTARTATTSTTFVDKTTLSVSSPVNAEHLLLSTHYIDSASTANRVEGKVIQDSTDIFTGSLQPISDTQLNDYNYFWVKRLVLSASTTFKSQVKKVSGSFGVGMGESALAVLQTETAGNLSMLGTFSALGTFNLQ